MNDVFGIIIQKASVYNTSSASVLLWRYNSSVLGKALLAASQELVDTGSSVFSLPLGIETEQTWHPHPQLGPSCSSWQSGTCISPAGGVPPCTGLPSCSVFGGVAHELGRRMVAGEAGWELWASPC